MAIGSLFFQRPAGHDFYPCYPRLIAKKLADSKKLLYKYHCASRELLCVRLKASSELVLYSLNQHFLAVYNVDTGLCDFGYSAACEVVDDIVFNLGINTLNSCRLCYCECE